MPAEVPKFLYDNLFSRFAAGVIASSAATGYPIANLCSWTVGRYWKQLFNSVPPANVTLRVFPVNGQLIPSNYVFEIWDAGVTEAPTGWTKVGAASTVARSALHVKAGNYSAALTRAGTDCWLQQAAYDAVSLRGSRVTAGVWAKAGAAATTYIGVYDGVTTHWSSAHGGGASPTFLSVTTPALAYNCAIVQVRLAIRTTDDTGYFSCPALVKGASLADTPHAQDVNAVGLFDHNGGTGGWTFHLEGSDDNFATTTGAESGALNPTTDRAFWGDLGSTVSRRAWQLRCLPGADSPGLYLAIAALGESVSLPYPIVPGFSPFARRMVSSMPVNRDGAPLGRAPLRAPRRFLFQQRQVQDTVLTSDLLGLIEHLYGNEAGGGGNPAFMRWAPTSRPTETALVWVPERDEMRAPIAPGLRISNWEFELEGYP